MPGEWAACHQRRRFCAVWVAARSATPEATSLWYAVLPRTHCFDLQESQSGADPLVEIESRLGGHPKPASCSSRIQDVDERVGTVVPRRGERLERGQEAA